MDLTDGNAGAAGADTTAAASSADFLGGGAAGAGAAGSGADAGTADAGADGGAAGTDAGAAGGDAGASDEFLNLFSGDAQGDSPSTRDWVKSKGFKSLDAMAAAYREAERTIRDKGLVKPPAEGASEAEMAAWREAIGVPSKAEDYATPEIKGADGQPVELNTALIDSLKGAAHKAGVPAEGFAALLNEAIQGQLLEADGMQRELDQRAKAYIDKNWKGQADSKLEQVDAGLQWMGLNKQEAAALRAALGPEKALEVAQKIGSNLKEDTLVRGSITQRFGMSAEAAQAKLDALKADPERGAKVMVPGSAERVEYERLNEIVAAEAERKLAAMT